ncbi:MAG: lipocalin family protein [Geothermobacteraceae bacterium]
MKKRRFLALLALLLGGCAGAPQGVEPVTGFQLERYLGTWYEIARLDHSFERGLSRVTAEYSLRDDGGIRVVNRGFNETNGEWKQAIGRAYVTGAADVGALKVSFFGPFYGGYNVIALDRDGYRWAMVCGPSRDYLWILARSPRLDGEVYRQLVAGARQLGFAVEGLIEVRQVPEAY